MRRNGTSCCGATQPRTGHGVKTVGRTAPVDVVNPRDLALPDVATLRRLTSAVVVAGGHQCWGDVVTVLATTALRISESAGLIASDLDLGRGLLDVNRQTYPGRGRLVTKTTKGRRRRVVAIIDPLRPTLERLTDSKGPDDRLIVGPQEVMALRPRLGGPWSVRTRGTIAPEPPIVITGKPNTGLRRSRPDRPLGAYVQGWRPRF
jgi:hypothetical protein